MREYSFAILPHAPKGALRCFPSESQLAAPVSTSQRESIRAASLDRVVSIANVNGFTEGQDFEVKVLEYRLSPALFPRTSGMQHGFITDIYFKNEMASFSVLIKLLENPNFQPQAISKQDSFELANPLTEKQVSTLLESVKAGMDELKKTAANSTASSQ